VLNFNMFSVRKIEISEKEKKPKDKQKRNEGSAL
jgi:hypothetical protein